MAKKNKIILQTEIENIPFTSAPVEEDIIMKSPKKVKPVEMILEDGLPFYLDENTSFVVENNTDTQKVRYTHNTILNTKTKHTDNIPELYVLSSDSISEVISPLEQNIGKYFKLKDLIVYDYNNPLYYELNNYPGVDKEYNGEEIVQNLKNLMENCVDKIIEYYPENFTLISAYRSMELNRMIGGASDNSHHIKGCAIDFKVAEEHTSFVFNWCIENIPEFHELMWAYPERGNKSWIHLSYKEGQNRKITTLASERENIHNEYGGERRGNRKEFQEGIKTANQDIV